MDSFQSAIAKFDAYNAQDPNKEMEGDHLVAREVLYAKRMTDCLTSFAPQAAEKVRLAARCQHIGRWQIPRNTFPEGRKGYLQWRNKLKDLHADIASKLLREAGYGDGMIEDVRSLVAKKELNRDPDAQLLEDVVCLVFIQYYLKEFSEKYELEKVTDILRKTLKKMSQKAKQAITDMHLGEGTRKLLEAL